MSGTFQLLFHFLLAGLTIGIGLATFSDRHWGQLIAASLLWLAFWIHVADSAWIPQWGTGRDWIDRIGIFTRGAGLALCSIALLAASMPWTLILGMLGIVLMIFGRAIWETIFVHSMETAKTDEQIVERERAGFRLFNLNSFSYGNWLFEVDCFDPPR